MKQNLLRTRNLKILSCLIIFLLLFLISFKVIFKDSGKKIKLNTSVVNISVGDTFELKSETDVKLKYECEDNSIATINNKGLIKAIKPGNTSIIIKGENGSLVKCKVNIYHKIDELKSSKKDIYIGVNDSEELKYEIKPTDASIFKREWNIENKDVAYVLDNKVIGLKKGDTTAKLTINNKYTIVFNIHVIEKIEELKIDDDIELYVNDTKKLDIGFTPESANEVPYSYSIEDDSILEVLEDNTIKGLKKGETKLTISTPYGVSKTINVKVKEIEVRSVSLNKSSVTITMNETYKLKVTVKPDEASDNSVTWKSSDTTVATVNSDGKVTPVKVGKTTITVESNNGKTDKCTVNVKNNTHDKTAIFIGDSITYGYKSSPKGYGWGDYIGEHYDIGKTTNAGKSGWLISNALGTSWLNDVVKDYKKKDYDYVILHGGTNDIKHGVTLGTFNASDYSGNYDTNTFLGGLETYLYTAKKQWPNAKMGFIITYQTPNSTENRRKLSAEYYTEMKKVLDKWNIPYLDLYFGKTSTGKKYSDLLKVNTYEYIVDGIHLNRAGYRLIAPHIYEWMNTL